MNNNYRKLTNDEELNREIEKLRSLIGNGVTLHETMSIKREHLSLLQKMFPKCCIAPVPWSLPSEGDIVQAKSVTLCMLQAQLQHEFPNSRIVLTVPSDPEEKVLSLEEYFANEITSEEERDFLRHAEKKLSQICSEELCEPDEILISVYPNPGMKLPELHPDLIRLAKLAGLEL